MGRFWRGRAEATLVDPTLRRLVLITRTLGWVWMTMLVVFGLTAEQVEPAYIDNRGVAVTALALATVWTGLTFWAAWKGGVLESRLFVVVDVLIAILVGGASLVAGTEELFHGGYPMSSLVVVAYAGGLWPALVVSIFMGVQQWLVRLGLGRSFSAAAFAVGFPILAVAVGWGFDAIREQSAGRSRAEKKLAATEADKARLTERADLANNLHDSVLQTLQAIKLEASQPDQVIYLARHQERELRRMIEQYRSPYGHSFKVALLSARDEVEDMHQVVIETVIKDDMPLAEDTVAVVEAAREAMLNAAKHSGADAIDVFSELVDGTLLVTVRDRGRGFDTSAGVGAGHGLANSMIGRIEQAGGTVDLASAPAEGTEVTIRLDRAAPPEDE